MRDILFRGKTKNRKEPAWIEGSLVRGFSMYDSKPTYFIYSLDTEMDNRGWIDNYWGEEVIPETVGQYTGLVDRNGKKIFEGDVLNLGRGCAYVTFKYFQWICKNENFGPYYWHRLEDYPENYEVVGNIYDNPELLERKER